MRAIEDHLNLILEEADKEFKVLDASPRSVLIVRRLFSQHILNFYEYIRSLERTKRTVKSAKKNLFMIVVKETDDYFLECITQIGSKRKAYKSIVKANYLLWRYLIVFLLVRGL